VTPSDPNAKMDIRVLVLMRHRMVREGIALLLKSDPDISEVITAGEGAGLVDQCRAEAPDVVIVDLDDPQMDARGLQELRETCPQARVVGVADSDDVELARRAVVLGIDGVYVKSANSQMLNEIILEVAAGGTTASLSAVDRKRRPEAEQVGQSAGLTPRELEVLREFALGKSTTKVADELGISQLTVQSHVKSILLKLGVHSKIEAVTMGFRLGLVSTPVPRRDEGRSGSTGSGRSSLA
jgi:DNA-binding NarL/FixJ family response regulator